MSEEINTINLEKEEVINNRFIDLNDKYIRTISINQINSDFAITAPLYNDGTVYLYPQSPNSINSFLNEIKEFKVFSGYSTINFPLDAKIDYIRNKMWIADTGNNRILLLNLNNYNIEQEINDIFAPHALEINLNNGNIFIKAFEDLTNGIIYEYNSSKINQFIFPEQYPLTSLEIEKTESFSKSLPLPNILKYDYVQYKLWWAAKNILYMADEKNKQIIEFNLYLKGFHDIKSISIDNINNIVLITALNNISNETEIIQVYKDNNVILGNTIIEV